MAVQIGIGLDEYNEMTPRELNLRAELFAYQKGNEQEEKLTLAYLTAYWQRVEKLESLEQILERLKDSSKPKQMTDFEMLIKVQELNAAMGGSVK